MIKKSIDEVKNNIRNQLCKDICFSSVLADTLKCRWCFVCLHVARGEVLVSCFQVNSAWENLNKTWKERVERLEEAMQAAVQFQDGLQVFEESSLK